MGQESLQWWETAVVEILKMRWPSDVWMNVCRYRLTNYIENICNYEIIVHNGKIELI